MTQIIVFYLLTAKLIEIRKSLSQDKIKELLLDLMILPEQLKFVLIDDSQIKKLAEKYKDCTNALFLGRGIQFPIALEGALKLKEVSYIHAEGYPAAEMKHGPIALIDKKMPVIVIATKDEFTYEKVLGNIQEVRARNGQVLAIATQGSKRVKDLADDVIEIPFTRYSLSSLLAVVPLQLFSYHVALLRGCDVDKPRNLAKSVTVE
jgi:glucosamine--fructose-6-phosphate aminotransferase (isomerizing)